MALIEVDKITKIFHRGDQEVAALAEVTVQIDRGEFIAITGPSGSGKSTLMYILGLLDVQTSGTYRLGGRETGKLSDDERARLRSQEIGFVFQSFHLLSRASALRNVMLPLVYAGSHASALSAREMKRRAEETLQRVGLGDRIHHLPNELSGGQCQRVAIARALVNNPRVIFADEPTGNLDTRRGLEILEVLKSLNAQGVTIILVTHDPSIAAHARRTLTIIDGRLVGDAHAAG
jgi:putative ABC transport system ATP-binding protein